MSVQSARNINCPQIGAIAEALFLSVNEAGLLRMAKAGENFSIFSEHWEPKWSKTDCSSQKFFTLLKKPDIPLIDALNDLINKGSIIDCRIMRGIAMHWCALHFSETTAACLNEPIELSNNCPVFVRCKALSFDYLPIGGFMYIANIPEYELIHPFGLYNGEHVCIVGLNEMGEKLYVGFGESFKVTKTLTEVFDALHEGICEPIVEELVNKRNALFPEKKIEMAELLVIQQHFKDREVFEAAIKAAQRGHMLVDVINTSL